MCEIQTVSVGFDFGRPKSHKTCVVPTPHRRKMRIWVCCTTKKLAYRLNNNAAGATRHEAIQWNIVTNANFIAFTTDLASHKRNIKPFSNYFFCQSRWKLIRLNWNVTAVEPTCSMFKTKHQTTVDNCRNKINKFSKLIFFAFLLLLQMPFSIWSNEVSSSGDFFNEASHRN